MAKALNCTISGDSEFARKNYFYPDLPKAYQISQLYEPLCRNGYLDIDAEEGLSRRRKGGGEWNRLDDYALDFHRRVREGYLEMARQNPQRWCIIDANRSRERVRDDIQQIVARVLPQRDGLAEQR